MSDIEFSTFADYDTVKGAFTSLYFIAVSQLSSYLMKPDYIRQRQATKALINLSLALNKKSYVLRDKEAVDYISYFITHPDEFHMMDLQTLFLICQNICEKLGLTRIESAQVPKHKAYTDDGN
jgi:hypothetical protein